MSTDLSGTSATGHARTTGWAGFWDRGGWWKAIGFAVVYLAVYLGVGWVIDKTAGGAIDPDDVFGDPLSVFLAVALPLVIGAIVLFAFAASVRWLPRPLFGRQPVTGRWWMWIAPVLVVITFVLRLFGIDWAAYTGGVIATTFLAGLFVGIAEEVLTRGIVVTLLRRHGYREWAVAVLSSLVFALLHTTNLLSGQPVLTVLVTVGFAFGFGMMMYLTLRVTGNLVWPIVLHALTDPSTILATGGIDVAGSNHSPLLSFAGLSTFVFLAFALLAMVFIRGSANGRAAAGEPELRTTVPTA
jgi:uncharacterized protein